MKQEVNKSLPCLLSQERDDYQDGRRILKSIIFILLALPMPLHEGITQSCRQWVISCHSAPVAMHYSPLSHTSFPTNQPTNPGNWRWHKFAAEMIAKDLAGPQTRLRCYQHCVSHCLLLNFAMVNQLPLSHPSHLIFRLRQTPYRRPVHQTASAAIVGRLSGSDYQLPEIGSLVLSLWENQSNLNGGEDNSCQQVTHSIAGHSNQTSPSPHKPFNL